MGCRHCSEHTVIVAIVEGVVNSISPVAAISTQSSQAAVQTSEAQTAQERIAYAVAVAIAETSKAQAQAQTQTQACNTISQGNQSGSVNHLTKGPRHTVILPRPPYPP